MCTGCPMAADPYHIKAPLRSTCHYFIRTGWCVFCPLIWVLLHSGVTILSYASCMDVCDLVTDGIILLLHHFCEYISIVFFSHLGLWIIAQKDPYSPLSASLTYCIFSNSAEAVLPLGIWYWQPFPMLESTLSSEPSTTSTVVHLPSLLSSTIVRFMETFSVIIANLEHRGHKISSTPSPPQSSSFFSYSCCCFCIVSRD